MTILNMACWVRGAWCLVRGVQCLVLLVLGSLCLVLLVLGALGAWCLGFGAWFLVLGAWFLVLGVHCYRYTARRSPTFTTVMTSSASSIEYRMR